jgi:hypothetical protein
MRWVACAAALAAVAASAAPWPVEPVLGLDFSLQRQALTASGASVGSEALDPSAILGASAGVRYRAWEQRLSFQTMALVALSTIDGHAIVGLQQVGQYRFEVTTWLSLGAGLAVTGLVDATTPALSSVLVSGALSLQAWRFELLWTPGVQVPLGGERRDAGDVRLTRSMLAGLVPISFALRFSFGPRS